MAVPSLRPLTSRPSDEVEVYHRTYTTLLRSSGETWLRVLEPAHRAMGSSLHAQAHADELDLGAFIYATRRLPAEVFAADRVVLGQEAVQFERARMPIRDWEPQEAPARRRRWFSDGEGTLAVLLASASDLDDLIPTLVAYQLEWNKLHRRLLSEPELPAGAPACAAALGGAESDWERVLDALGTTLEQVRDRGLDLRVRM